MSSRRPSARELEAQQELLDEIQTLVDESLQKECQQAQARLVARYEQQRAAARLRYEQARTCLWKCAGLPQA